MVTSMRPEGLIKLLRAYYVPNYDAGTAFAQAVSMHLALPGLRAFWPFSSVSELGNVFDLSGQGRTLSPSGGAGVGVQSDSIYPYGSLASGSSQYFTRADEAGLSITNELTIGGWFYFDTIPASSMGLISKNETAGNQRAYTLFRNSNNTARFQVSSNGTTTTAVDSAATFTVDNWHFVAGRFTPSIEMSVWVDDSKVVNPTPPAAIFDSTALFALGRTDGGNYLNGRAAFCFVCASALSDVTINVIKGRMKPLFNK